MSYPKVHTYYDGPMPKMNHVQLGCYLRLGNVLAVESQRHGTHPYFALTMASADDGELVMLDATPETIESFANALLQMVRDVKGV